jgi:hypothetical protein
MKCRQVRALARHQYRGQTITSVAAGLVITLITTPTPIAPTPKNINPYLAEMDDRGHDAIIAELAGPGQGDRPRGAPPLPVRAREPRQPQPVAHVLPLSVDGISLMHRVT